MKINKKNILIITSLLVLSNCSSLVPIAPTSMESAFKYIGYGKGAADVVSYKATGKTTTDHFISAAIGKDCKIGRIIKKKPVCVEFDAKTYKYKLFNKGELVSKNNVIKMEFPSEIYNFNKTLEKDLKIKLNSPKKIKLSVIK